MSGALSDFEAVFYSLTQTNGPGPLGSDLYIQHKNPPVTVYETPVIPLVRLFFNLL